MSKVKKSKVINLTPHVIVIYDQSGRRVIEKIPRDDDEEVARCDRMNITDLEPIRFGRNEIPLQKSVLGRRASLPEPREGVWLIVSGMVRHRHPERRDLLSPDTTPSSVIKARNGRIIGVKRLLCNG